MDTNLDLLRYFKDTYLNKLDDLKIIRVGYSKDSVSSLFRESNWKYDVLDVDNGSKEVDVIVKDINNWIEVNDESFDVVVSKNFTDLKYFWLVMFQIERALKPSGYVCIIVPNVQFVNNSSDILNIFTPNSLESLADYVNFNVIEVIEKDLEICLIAQKNEIAKHLFLDSYEKEMFKNKCDIALEKYESTLNRLDKFNNNPELNRNLAEIKHLLFDFNSSTHVYCPICKSIHNSFSPFDKPFRLDAQCPECHSLEKHRLLYLFLTDKFNILAKDVNLLHLEPDASLYGCFNKCDNIDYHSVGVALSSTVDKVIDFENIDFSEDSFDISILDYETLNNYEYPSTILKELYRIIKHNGEGCLLINCSSMEIDDQDFEFFINQLKNTGFHVSKFDSLEIVDGNLMETYGLTHDCILLCEKR